MRQVLLSGIVYSFICLFTINAQMVKQVIGAPVCPHPVTYITSEGDQLTLFPKGDNTSGFFLTEDGLPAVKIDNQYHYAMFKDGQWLADDREVMLPGQITAKQHKKYKGALVTAQNEQFVRTRLKAMQLDASVQSKGNINVLLILVDFSNQSHTRTSSEIEQMFNGAGSAAQASFKKFYQQASHQQLNISVDVSGWYNCNEPYTNFSDAKGMYLTGNLVRKAVDMAEADGIDFSKYDNNGDGKADAIMVMHAGLGADHRSETQYIWPHSWSLSSTVNKAVTYDGVRVDNYVIACEMREYNGQKKGAGIGTFVHEFGHALGLPDLYDGTGKSSGLGHWAMMSAGSWLDGGYRPANFCAWSRVELGWEMPQVLSANDYASYELLSSTSNANQVMQIETTDAKEYFLLENRQRDYNDAQQPAAGLAVYHIHRDKIKKSRGVNDDRDLPGIRLVEADFSVSGGLYGGDDRGSYSDLFPGPQNKTTLGAFSSPGTKLFNGGFSGVEIEQIQHKEGKITFALVAPKPTMNWQNSNLFESYLNDGSIRNVLKLELNNAAFSVEGGVLPKEAFQVMNLPSGLSVQVMVKSATTAEVMISGKAEQHEADNDVSNLSLQFTDAAFKSATADQVYQSANDQLRIFWLDQEEGVRLFWEDFEQCQPPAFPEGWEIKAGSKGTASHWETCVGNNHTSLGRYGVQFYDKNSQKEEFWLVSPAIDLTGFHDIKFSFWEKYDLNGEAKNRVAVSTDKINWHIIYDGHPEKNDTWEEAVAAIPKAFEGETIYLGFCMYDTHAWGWFWDDVALYNNGINAVIELQNDPLVQVIYDTDTELLQLKTVTPMRSVELINLQGVTLLKTTSQELHLNDFSHGIYIILVQMEDNSHKVIKFRK